MSDEAIKGAIEKELRFLAQKIHSDGLSDAPNWGVRTSLVHLGSIISKIRPAEWLEHPKDALLIALSQAISPLKHEPMEIGRLTYGYAAERLFGFVSIDIPPVKGRVYDAVVNHLLTEAEVLPTQTRDRRRFTEDVRRALAEKLFLMLSKSREIDRMRKASVSDDLVERRSILSEIDAAISGSACRAILWGESGTGKTFLAEVTAERHRDWRRQMTIRGSIAHKSPVFHENLITALAIVGIDARGWALAACCSALRDVVKQPHSVDLLFLDDADEETIDYFVASSAVRTIVTTQIRPRNLDASMIAVHSFTASESLAYWRLRLPNADEFAAKEIARRLGHRPLALHIGSSMVRAGVVSVGELLEVCRSDSSGLVDAGIEIVGDSRTRSLIAVYKRLIEFINADATAMQMLMGILWLSEGLLLKNMIATMAFPSSRALPTRVSWSAAYSKLLRCGLLREKAEDVEVNDLSLAILRRLLSEESDHQIRRFFDGVCAIGLNAASIGESGVLGEVMSDPLGDMWEAITKDIPQRAGDVDAIRKSLLAGNVAAVQSTLMILAPGINFGCYCLTPHTWLLWQKDCVFFAEPDGTDQLAVAYLDHDRIVTRPEISPPNARDFFVNLLVPLSDIHTHSSDNFFLRLSPERFHPFGPTTWRISAGRRHLAAFAFAAPDVLADLSMPCWSRCGTLFFPGRIEDFEICNECLEPNPMASESTWIETLDSWEKVIEYWGSRADWKFRFLLYATHLTLLRDGSRPIGIWKRAAATIPGSHTDRTARLLTAWIISKAIEDTIRCGVPSASGVLGRALQLLNDEDLHRPTESAILRSLAACLIESPEFSGFHGPLQALSAESERGRAAELKDLIGAVAKEWKVE